METEEALDDADGGILLPTTTQPTRAQDDYKEDHYAGHDLYKLVETGVIVRKCEGLIGLSGFWRF